MLNKSIATMYLVFAMCYHIVQPFVVVVHLCNCRAGAVAGTW